MKTQMVCCLMLMSSFCLVGMNNPQQDLVDQPAYPLSGPENHTHVARLAARKARLNEIAQQSARGEHSDTEETND